MFFKRKPNVGDLQTNSDINGLIKALTFRRDAEVRRAAAGALGELGDARAIVPLQAAQSDPDTRVAAAITGALRQLGALPAEEAIDETPGPVAEPVPPDAGASVAAATSETVTHPGLLLLLEKLRTLRPHELAKEQDLPDAFLNIGEPAVVALLDMLESESGIFDNHRANAVYVLERILGKVALDEEAIQQAINRLVESLVENTSSVRTSVAALLETLDWVPRDATEESYLWLARQEWQKISAMGEAGFELLCKALDTTFLETKVEVAEVLLATGNPRAIDVLIELLTEKQPAVQAVGLGTVLGSSQNPRIIEPMVAILYDENQLPSNREAAVAALAQLGSRDDVVEALTTAWFNDESRDVRMATETAIVEILELTTETHPRLAALFTEQLQHSSADRRHDAAVRLAKIGGRSMIPALEAMMTAEKDQFTGTYIAANNTVRAIKARS
ncbi:MAG: HEAT repeat domain-containing protein [Anaerolineae bacterium]|nr:HEAT repeat domain-containing protein [Anaerolineae bacterium]